jgi:hypothetical protein
MSTILCVAATHLSILCPSEPTYTSNSVQLLSKSLRLLRQNLSVPITKENCDAMAGSTILMNYILWCNLDFLGGQRLGGSRAAGAPGLDLSQDQLFLLSPGVLHVYLQALPIFLSENSVFISIGQQRPRLNIEEVLLQRGDDPARFVEPFMRIWDDPRYQTCGTYQPAAIRPLRYPSPLSWSLFVQPETELAWKQVLALMSSPSTKRHGPQPDNALSNMDVCAAVNGVAAAAYPAASGESSVSTALQAMFPKHLNTRTAFEGIVRRLSPILCWLSPLAISTTDVAIQASAMPRKADFQRLFFAFPILCCEPFLELMMKGDSRALVLLYHFYRAARILLLTQESWWANERSRVLEGLILREMESRGLSVCLRDENVGWSSF